MAFRTAAPRPQTAQFNDASLAFPAALQRADAWLRGIGAFQSVRSDDAGPARVAAAAASSPASIAASRPRSDPRHASGYNHTDLSQFDGTSGTVDTPRLIASGLYRAGPNALDGTLGAAYDRIGTSRPVASSGTNANEGHNGAEKNAARAAYPLAPGDMVLMAHLALQCLQLD